MSKNASISMGIGLASLGAAAAAYMAVRPVPPPRVVEIVVPPYIRAKNSNHCEVKVNTKSIRWIAKYGSAYYVCARPDGCLDAPYAPDKFIVDPAEEPESFAVLSKL